MVVYTNVSASIVVELMNLLLSLSFPAVQKFMQEEPCLGKQLLEFVTITKNEI